MFSFVLTPSSETEESDCKDWKVAHFIDCSASNTATEFNLRMIPSMTEDWDHKEKSS